MVIRENHISPADYGRSVYENIWIVVRGSVRPIPIQLNKCSDTGPAPIG
jgi:hypothetical protein